MTRARPVASSTKYRNRWSSSFISTTTSSSRRGSGPRLLLANDPVPRPGRPARPERADDARFVVASVDHASTSASASRSEVEVVVEHLHLGRSLDRVHLADLAKLFDRTTCALLGKARSEVGRESARSPFSCPRPRRRGSAGLVRRPASRRTPGAAARARERVDRRRSSCRNRDVRGTSCRRGAPPPRLEPDARSADSPPPGERRGHAGTACSRSDRVLRSSLRQAHAHPPEPRRER